ncbi:hypothetical protein pRL80114 (plasmid) [Rhizobium johnstonii 3841]|uniref:Uncharacterized protein n=1 Tax=Rhizobium johnstonii (strain DSM 114642 / LMG 32736 / 3841) TaxID=216596 RepID=Q1M9A6_RHIJ3|nr:hypothetical protein pRL80114 [Rhizobium johnstonii 3841]
MGETAPSLTPDLLEQNRTSEREETRGPEGDATDSGVSRRGVSRGEIPDSLVGRAIRLTKLTDAAKAPSEGGLRLEPAILLGNDDGQLGARQLEFDLDLATFVGIDALPELGPQFFDLDFNVVGHRLISLDVKDDDSGREGMAGSGIAQATGRAGEWGSRFSEGATGGCRKLGEPLILEAGMRERHTPGF